MNALIVGVMLTIKNEKYNCERIGKFQDLAI